MVSTPSISSQGAGLPAQIGRKPSSHRAAALDGRTACGMVASICRDGIECLDPGESEAAARQPGQGATSTPNPQITSHLVETRTLSHLMDLPFLMSF